MLLEAKELSMRMNLSEVSQRLLGWDIRAGPYLEDPSLMNDSTIPISPSRSPSKKSRFRRPQTEDERHEQYETAAIVLDLEVVIWAYISLEEYQEAWEQLER